jgi:hypothetical protein
MGFREVRGTYNFSFFGLTALNCLSKIPFCIKYRFGGLTVVRQGDISVNVFRRAVAVACEFRRNYITLMTLRTHCGRNGDPERF